MDATKQKQKLKLALHIKFSKIKKWVLLSLIRTFHFLIQSPILVWFWPIVNLWNLNKHTCKTSFFLFHLWNFAKFWSTLVHACVSSRLDDCNAVIGTPTQNIQKLHVQNRSARILMSVHKFEHITPVLRSFYWLHVSDRIKNPPSHFSLSAWKSTILLDFLTLYCLSHTLCSSNTNLLHIPEPHTHTIGD